MPSYNPAAWFWIAGNKPSQVFSSAAAAYVAPTDAAYQAFVAGGGRATKILCDGELADVLMKAGAAAAVVAAAGATSTGGLPPAEAAIVLLAVGVNVTSAATPALNGVYAVDAATQQDIAAEAQYVSTFAAYSGGQTTLLWPDITGAPKAFPADLATTKTFLAFARAAADYRTAVSLAAAAAAAGGTPSWPSRDVALP